MSKSVMIIDTPRDCCECPFGTMAFGKSICLLDEGNGIECPLKPYKDFIHIEWIKKKKVDFQNKDYPFNYCRGMQDGFNDCIDYLLSEWEKESRKGEEEK